MAKGNFFSKFFNGKNKNEVNSTPKISYSSSGPSGHVIYQSNETKFSLYYEYGSGSCVATVFIPSIDEWEKQTKLGIEQREEVLQIIGNQVVKDQTSSGSGSFKIEGKWLHIYS